MDLVTHIHLGIRHPFPINMDPTVGGGWPIPSDNAISALPTLHLDARPIRRPSGKHLRTIAEMCLPFGGRTVGETVLAPARTQVAIAVEET